MNSGGRYVVSLCMGLTAGLFGWSVLELILSLQDHFPTYTAVLLVSGGLTAAVMTAVIASLEGILHKSTSKINREWSMGLVWGLAGGMIGAFFGQFLFSAILPDTVMPENYKYPYFAARTISWTVMGIFIGTAEGLRARSMQKFQAGLISGALGGFVGGALVEMALLFFPGDSWLKLPGFIIMGMGTAVLTIAIEIYTSPGVLRVLNGGSKGRKYMINQKKTRVGAHQGCDITLQGGSDIPPVAVTFQRKGRELVMQAEEGFHALVNDDPIDNRTLKYEDVIKIGNTKFMYEVKQ
ncbi:MAG: FHA domain-containing protein [Spirochaetales bacterium]|nr:FHA domain-containing protein [Spirochaetales bacterium]